MFRLRNENTVNTHPHKLRSMHKHKYTQLRYTVHLIHVTNSRKTLFQAKEIILYYHDEFFDNRPLVEDGMLFRDLLADCCICSREVWVICQKHKVLEV